MEKKQSEEAKPKSKSRLSYRNKKVRNQISIRLWLASLVSVILNILFVFNLQKNSNNLVLQLTELSQLNKQITLFSAATNSIPQLAEKYGFTLSSVYLQRYWYLLQFNNNINLLTTEFNQDPTVRELYNEIQSKNQELRNDEFHALKLIFMAYDIPNEVINDTIKAYELSDEETLLSNVKKLQAAQSILYNVDRNDKLDSIKEEINILQAHIETKTQIKIDDEKAQITLFFYLLYITNCILFIFILSILWLRQLHKL